MSLKYLFAQPDYIEIIIKDNIENKNIIKSITIYPIKLKDYEEFSKYSSLLYLSKNHFDESVRDNSLLELLYLSHSSLGLTTEDFINNLCKLFSIVTLKEVDFIEKDGKIAFWIDENGFIDQSNYEKVRVIIMKQNLIHEQKVYKTKLMAQWAEKALLAKQKTAPKISLEDIVSTVSVGCHKHYWDLENYTIYQIYSDFYRLRKIIEHDSSVQFKCAGADLKLPEFAEDLDLYHNPYDDLFVSSDKLTGLNKALKD